MFYFTNFFSRSNAYIWHSNTKKVLKQKEFKQTSTLQFLQPTQIPQAYSYGNSLGEGPSTVIVIRSVKILLGGWLHRLILIRDSAEKPLSQSTVNIGKRRQIASCWLAEVWEHCLDFCRTRNVCHELMRWQLLKLTVSSNSTFKDH